MSITRSISGSLPPSIPVSRLDVAGATDLGAAIQDTDLIIVNQRKSAFSRVWTAIKAKIDAGLTIAGVHAFSSTTRPTSAGTGTPAANSLITLADGDARFFVHQAARQGAALSKTNDTVEAIASLTIAAGTYHIIGRALAQVVSGGNTGGGAKAVLSGVTFSDVSGSTEKFSSHASNKIIYLQSTSGVEVSISNTDYSDSLWYQSGYGGVFLCFDIVAVCTAGTLALTVAQRTTNANPTVFPANQGFLSIRKVG